MRHIIILVFAVICSSCGISKIGEQVEVKGFTTIELKGMTGLKTDAYVINDSRHKIKMSNAEVTLYHNDRQVIVLSQIGEAMSEAKSRGDVEMMWKMSGFNIGAISTFTSLLSKRNFEGVDISYSARFSVKGMSRTISQENVDLQNFIAIFAK